MNADDYFINFSFLKKYLKSTNDAFILFAENEIKETSENIYHFFNMNCKNIPESDKSSFLKTLVFDMSRNKNYLDYKVNVNGNLFDYFRYDFINDETLFIFKEKTEISQKCGDMSFEVFENILEEINYSNKIIINEDFSYLDKFEKKAYEKKESVSYISQLKDNENSVKKWFLTKKIPFFCDGNIESIACYSIDIDEFMLSRIEILNSEEYFKLVVEKINNGNFTKNNSVIGMALEASDIGVWIWDFENDVVAGDKPWHRFFRNVDPEVKSDPHFIRRFENSIHPDDIETIAVNLVKHLEGKTEYFERDFRIYFDNLGEFRWVMDRGKVMIYDSQGKPAIMVGTFKDISERKDLEYQLIKAKENAEKLNKMKSDFISNINHELRTPLTVIMGITETLIGIEEDDEKKYFLEKLFSSANNLFTVLNNLIEISRINSENDMIFLSFFNPQSLMKEITDKYAAVCKSKKLDFIVQYDDKIPGKIKWIPEHFKLLVNNLLENSLKFTESGYVKLALNLIGYRKNMVEIELVLEDTGIGIEEKYYATLFDYFFQVDSSNVRKYSGTGMGLAICKEIVDSVGGDISVKSEYGRGTVFTVKLKLEYS